MLTIYQNPSPTQTQSTSLIRAVVLLLAQMVEQENIVIRSRSDMTVRVQRCLMVNEKNWSWVTL